MAKKKKKRGRVSQTSKTGTTEGIKREILVLQKKMHIGIYQLE